MSRKLSQVVHHFPLQVRKDHYHGSEFIQKTTNHVLCFTQSVQYTIGVAACI